MSKYGAAGRIVAPYPTPWGHNHEKPGSRTGAAPYVSALPGASRFRTLNPATFDPANLSIET